jgi:hypothetical protein
VSVQSRRERSKGPTVGGTVKPEVDECCVGDCAQEVTERTRVERGEDGIMDRDDEVCLHRNSSV